MEGEGPDCGKEVECIQDPYFHPSIHQHHNSQQLSRVTHQTASSLSVQYSHALSVEDSRHRPNKVMNIQNSVYTGTDLVVCGGGEGAGGQSVFEKNTKW